MVRCNWEAELFGGTGDANLHALKIDQALLAKLLPSQADFIELNGDATDAIDALGANVALDQGADWRPKDVLATGPNIDPARFLSVSPFGTAPTESLRDAFTSGP